MKEKAPILLLTFNRPDETFEVLKSIKKYAPKQLFISSDGYRAHVSGEKELVIDLRKKILDFIDWNCDVKVKFYQTNLGCKKAVFNSINWFFNNVNSGIILEDDIIVDLDFFNFCFSMLKKYETSETIYSICGYNPISINIHNGSYFFSKYFFSWGWATWKNRWDKIDIDFEVYKKLDLQKLKIIYPSFLERKIRVKKYNDSINNKNSSWANPWVFTHHLHHACSVINNKNLVRNIGFSKLNSTHTKENFVDKIFMDKKAHNISWPLTHPNKIKINQLNRYMFILREITRVFLKKVLIK